LEAVAIEQPAGEVDSDDRAVRRGALPRQTDSGERCTVRAAGQQADIGRRVVWGQFGAPRRTISGFVRTSSFSPASSVPMVKRTD
jgi:hypothetical protein